MAPISINTFSLLCKENSLIKIWHIRAYIRGINQVSGPEVENLLANSVQFYFTIYSVPSSVFS